jgi:hypothetical protein
MALAGFSQVEGNGGEAEGEREMKRRTDGSHPVRGAL